MDIKPLTNIEIGHKNRIEALLLIWRFRWLRPLELGQMMWLTSKNPQQQGAALIKKLKERKLVVLNKLPEGAGTAAILSERGARLLRDEVANQNMTIDSKSQNWGRVVDGKFVPNNKWKHDLLAHSLLILLKRKGAKNIYAETEILRRYSLSEIGGKAPDGLFSFENNHYWLEQERTSKRGKDLEDLIKQLEKVAENKSQTFFDMKPHRMAIAIPPNERDYRGKLIDHRKNIEAKIQKTITTESVRVYFFHLEIKGHAVIDFVIEPAKIVANTRLRSLEEQAKKQRRWDKEQDEKEWEIQNNREYMPIAGLPGFIIELFDSDGKWHWLVYQQLYDERHVPIRTIPYQSGASTSKAEARAQALAAGKAIRDGQNENDPSEKLGSSFEK